MDFNQIILNYGITATAARVLLAIRGFVAASNYNGKRDKFGPYCYASQAQIGAKLGLSERTIQRAVHALKSAGLIFVRRTPGRARIYILAPKPATNGGTEPATDGGSIEDINNNNIDFTTQSIQPNSMERPTAASAMKPCTPRQPERPAKQPRPIVQQTGEAPEQGEQKKPPIDHEAQIAARERYSDFLRDRLGLYSFAYTMPEFESEFQQREAFVNYIANLMTCDKDFITIRGNVYGRAEFWNCIKQITGQRLNFVLERVRGREKTTSICNPAAYVAAAAFCELRFGDAVS